MTGGVDTFIGRHGYVQYSDIGKSSFPRIRSCEVCGMESGWLESPSATHLPFYVFDHCHSHGWVRGILCAPCNMRMRNVDLGKARDARYTAHWSTCPDCKLGAPPRPPKPRPCRRCRGCGYLWISCLIRMVRCPDCRDGDSQ